MSQRGRRASFPGGAWSFRGAQLGAFWVVQHSEAQALHVTFKSLHGPSAFYLHTTVLTAGPGVPACSHQFLVLRNGFPMVLGEVSRRVLPSVPRRSSHIRRALLMQVINGSCKGVFCSPCFWPGAGGDLRNRGCLEFPLLYPPVLKVMMKSHIGSEEQPDIIRKAKSISTLFSNKLRPTV